MGEFDPVFDGTWGIGQCIFDPVPEQFIRQADGRWLLKESAGLKAILELPSLHISISLAEVFAKVNFVPAPIRAASPRGHSNQP